MAWGVGVKDMNEERMRFVLRAKEGRDHECSVPGIFH